jgi:uncharacterized protein YjdB
MILMFTAGCGYKSPSTTTTTTQIATITISPPNSAVSVGQNQAFTATVKNSDGSILSGGVLSWSSSATNVATIDSAGLATGVAPGATNITASSEGVTSTAVPLTVLAKVASVTISAPSTTVKAGSTLQFTAVANDASGNAIQGAVFQWSSSASSIATIDNTGLVTGVSPGGPIMITASSGGISSAPFMLTVN